MKKSIIYLVTAALVGLLALNSCDELESWVPGIDITDGDDNKEDEEKPDDKPGEGEGGADVVVPEGLAYVWDFDAIPEIHLEFKLDQWNSLLAKYDKDNKTKEYVKCDVTYKKGSDVFEIKDAGIRLRGNTSRRRPEGGSGEHVKDTKDWKHCHFGLNLRKYVKDDAHQIHGIRKMNLKWFNNDPAYVREVFSYDLFERAGVWTASQICYARLWLHVEGDAEPVYYGVYSMIEPYDNKYLERKPSFGSANGNLWKCTYTSNGPADLRNPDANFGEDDNVHEYTYELKETGGNFADAKSQLQDFIRKLNGKDDESFKAWFSEICDVNLFLKTYAVNVALGMWDDHWNNGNNYYLYFNSLDKENYKLFFLPYDYDNTLGTSNTYDPAKQNPLEWGTMGKLMRRVIKIPEFKAIYIEELKKLVDPANGLMDYDTASKRVLEWQGRIKDYVSNDTGEDMSIVDTDASWSGYDYHLIDKNKNFFIEKANAINNIKN